MKINALVAIFGFMSTFTLYTYLGFFPAPYFHQKHFVYPILFGIPIYWYVCNELKINNRNTFSIYMSSIIIQFLFSFYLILPHNKLLSPEGFNVKYSDFAIFGLPFTDEEKSKKIFYWYKDKSIKNDDYIMTNTRGRYVNAMLNMAQNRYIKIGSKYKFKTGFIESTNENIVRKMSIYKPKFIHWSSGEHYSFHSDKNDIKEINSYSSLKNEFFNAGYALVDSLDNEIFFFEKNYKN